MRLDALALTRDFDFQATGSPPGRPLGDRVSEAHVPKSTAVERVRGPHLPWEPCWEPFSVDSGGRLWTDVESGAVRSGLCGQAWALTDAAWRSTDQEVGGSSPSRRADGIPCATSGGFAASAVERCLVLGHAWATGDGGGEVTALGDRRVVASAQESAPLGGSGPSIQGSGRSWQRRPVSRVRAARWVRLAIS
jgi:hypothetical protein